jgi:phage/plasmid-like protein (TIGR03299 family)
MFSVREVPWHGLGTIVQDALTSKEAIVQAGLDWTVVSQPVFVDGNVADGYIANVRNTDGKILGIVTGKYKIVQNEDAFEWTDLLVQENVKYETAGSLANGKKVWLLARMPEGKILGDEVIPYLVFANSHDGIGAIKVCLTPVRVVCQNTLNLALNGAKRTWSTKHMGDMASKLNEARNTLQIANTYINELGIVATKLSSKSVTTAEVKEFIDELFPIEVNATNRQIANMETLRDGFNFCYNNRPDIAKFNGTKWGVINAMSDLITHMEPLRKTETYQENMFMKVAEGHNVLDKAYELLAA